MKELLTSLRLVALSIVVCCVIYPALLLAFAQTVVPWKADGSLLVNEQGQIVGSAQLAQGFTRPGYFWPRPSAVNYNASATGGSNLSPKNPALTERAREVIGQYGGSPARPVPADLVSASGSGMDPHITLAAARYQIQRVADVRGMQLHQIETLIAECSEVNTLRVFGGEPLVNVLCLNLALDALQVENP